MIGPFKSALRTGAVSLAATLGAALWLNAPANAQILEAGGAAQDQARVEQADGAAEEDEGSGFLKVSWPKISLPEIKPPSIEFPKLTLPWSGGDGASIFAPIESGAQKISEGTKQAWIGFKGIFSSDANKGSKKKARGQRKESFWSRLFSEPEPEGPRTVGEWMSQPRLDP